MPSGKTHDRITLWLLPAIVIAAYLLTRSSDLTLLCAVGFFVSGLILGPDLDIHSLHYRRWGWLRFFWLPYQKLIPHRSWLSHGFLVGTSIRLLYLSVWLFLAAALLLAIAQLFIGFDWNWHSFAIERIKMISDRWQLAIALFIGLELGSMSHYLSDGLVTSRKKRRK